MDQVYIVGAGGFGREVAHWLTQSPDCGTKWRLAGFLDDNAEALKGFSTDLKVVGSIQGYRPNLELREQRAGDQIHRDTAK